MILLLGVCAAVGLGDGGGHHGGHHPQPGYGPPPAPAPYHPPAPAPYYPPAPIYGGGFGGKGKGGRFRRGKGGGKGKGGDYGHIDFGPPRYTYEPVTQYRQVQVKRPVTVYRTSTIKQPYTSYKKVVQQPQPRLIKRPVVTQVQEWRLVNVPKTTYEQVWVYPRYREEKGKGKGCLFCGKGKGKGASTKGKGEQIVYHQPHHQQQSYPRPLPAVTYGSPPKGHH